MKRLRRILIVSCAGAGVWLFLSMGIGVFAIEGALHPQRSAPSLVDQQKAAELAARHQAVLSDVQISAADGAKLRGWVIVPRRSNGDAVILLHGQGDNRNGMLGPGELLLSHGFTVVLPDARGHGKSEGSIVTYGVLEADDVRRWYLWLEQSHAPRCIDGLGDSMGGAELLNALALETHFCAVIAESSFANFREAAFDRLGQRFSAGPWMGRTLLRPAFYFGVTYALFRYGVDLRHADPARAVAQSAVPVMLIHGRGDRNLPLRHSELIKAGSGSTILWEPGGADHCGASQAAPAEYERRVTGWFEGHHRI